MDTFRALGATVARIEGVGHDAGVPDLLVGFGGQTALVEIKTPKGRLSKAQIDWHRRWMGSPVVIVRSVAEARDFFSSFFAPEP